MIWDHFYSRNLIRILRVSRLLRISLIYFLYAAILGTFNGRRLIFATFPAAYAAHLYWQFNELSPLISAAASRDWLLDISMVEAERLTRADAHDATGTDEATAAKPQRAALSPPPWYFGKRMGRRYRFTGACRADIGALIWSRHILLQSRRLNFTHGFRYVAASFEILSAAIFSLESKHFNEFTHSLVRRMIPLVIHECYRNYLGLMPPLLARKDIDSLMRLSAPSLPE